MADHRVKLAAGAGVGRQVAADADHRIAMGEVGGAVLGIVDATGQPLSEAGRAAHRHRASRAG